MATDCFNEFVMIDGESFICIRGVASLAPFLMSIVSDSDHWLFVGSNGPFTAGRVDADRAVFPYQTADKILRHSDTSGSLTFIQVKRGSDWVEWTPIERNLYKHIYGTEVIFEEADQDLRFRWSLTSCEPYGFVKECTLENMSGAPLEVRYLDGWHQMLPPNLAQSTYADFSYLAAAYMRHEAHPDGLAHYTLNARISDRAEACESLRAACAWSLGHENPVILLSDRQVESFRKGFPVTAEAEIRGEMGAYLTASSAKIVEKLSWVTVVDTWMDQAAILRLQKELKEPAQLRRSLKAAVAENRNALRRRIAAADGLQETADKTAAVHHFANVLFNCMRGGAFTNGGRFPAADFADFVKGRNRGVYEANQEWILGLAPELTISEVRRAADDSACPQLKRLASEYLPLSFSRRHGDPSRPWNRFNIHLKNEHGDPIFSYQGNWRDIFQNWESLGYSYPQFFEQMVSTFLNASTGDGYNPYRIGKEGIDWEVPEPSNPWSNIGYWGDHQVVYLLRLLEGWEKFYPGSLNARLHQRGYAYARVPYEIAGFDDLILDPKNSISFNWELHEKLMADAKDKGGDGKLMTSATGDVLLVSLAEKLLIPALAKLSNLVPGGGIWLNTQRPEWNDANNALAGWGLSMVTVCYLRRYLAFLEKVFLDSEVEVTSPAAQLLHRLTEALSETEGAPASDSVRFAHLEKLMRAGEDHRKAVYAGAIKGTEKVSARSFIRAALSVLDETIRASRREDGLYHSYNVLHIKGQEAKVQHLNLMLEGQVAALSSGVLSLEETCHLLASLRKSDLYREDQKSYILYPDRVLTPFLDRNTFDGPPPLMERSLFSQDPNGRWRFQADLRNAGDVEARLNVLGAEEPTRQAVLALWEETFHHKEFTGRSGTMFMFEGLGSIYWHMIAKLLLAVQENYHKFGDESLHQAYHDIRDGLGFRKTAEEYGAFPTDPYSHTPKHRGAQQPGMTGQVKEEILTRWGELGVSIEDGCLRFAPKLLPCNEFHQTPLSFHYVDVNGQDQEWLLPEGSLGFTFCQVPVAYVLGEGDGVEVEMVDGTIKRGLTTDDSASIFARANLVKRVTVSAPREMRHRPHPAS